MLDRSHRRLEQRLAELSAAAVEYRLEEAREVCDFLRKAAARHETDEEESVFPRLDGAGELTAALAAEHREHAAKVAELASVLGESVVDKGRLVAIAVTLEQMYAEHLAREEAELMPRVRDLDARALATIYAEMQSRRGR